MQWTLNRPLVNKYKKVVIFSNRLEAGKILAERFLGSKPRLTNPIVLGIPRGGIPIGSCIAKALNCQFDIIVLKKLPIPSDPEAGFGAVTLDNTVIFNDALLSRLYLEELEINKIVKGVYREVLRRNKVYRKQRPFPSLEGRSVILTDDGLATGFTMLAGIKFAQKRNAREIVVTVPVAHRSAYNMVKKEADKIVVLHIGDLPYFAVASFYREFPEMSDKEVISYLQNSES